jgi:hypothetical protein
MQKWFIVYPDTNIDLGDLTNIVIGTADHSKALSQGYMLEPADWRNCKL